MRKFLSVAVALLAVAACTKDGHLAGDDPTRNDEAPGEGPPMTSNPSASRPTNEVTPDKQRPYADDNATEQTTTAPPDPEPKPDPN
jgi:hypothetical protein